MSRSRPNEVRMKYEISEAWGTDIDEVLEFGKRLKTARDFVKSNNDVICNVKLHSDSPPGFTVSIEKFKGDLDKAVHDYFEAAGEPHFIEYGSDYSIVEKNLCQGKRLKRAFVFSLSKNPMGKYVVFK